MANWRLNNNATIEKSIVLKFKICKSFLHSGIEFAPIFLCKGVF